MPVKKHPCLFVITALLLTVALYFAPLGAPVATFAAETFAAQKVTVLYEGTCGEQLTWKLDSTGAFTVSGTGAMYHYTGPGSGDAPWLKHQELIRTVIIEDGVTAIGNYAFYQCTELEGVSLPQSLTSIGHWAFYNCPVLSEVYWSDRLETIGDYAFGRCGLSELQLPDSVTKTGIRAFDNCTALQSAVVPPALTDLSSGLFYGCTALREVFLPLSVRHIGVSAFSGCKSLRNVYYTGTTTQWYAMQISSDNDYLKNADITFNYQAPSDIVDASDITPVFYTNRPFTALRTGETMELLVRLYKNGELLPPSDSLLLNTLSPGIIANRTTTDGWAFTFKADYDTYNDVLFQIPGTNFGTTASFYTFNGTHTFHCFEPWMPDLSRSTLQIDNFHCDTPEQQPFNHALSFDAYNSAYSWGVIITDSGMGTPDILPIPSKINDGSDIIVDGQRYMAVHTDASGQWTSSSTGNPVQLSLLGGKQIVTYTADGTDSLYPALFTAIHIATRWAVNEAGFHLTDEELQAVSLSMIRRPLDEGYRKIALEHGERMHTLLTNGHATHTLISEVYALYLDLHTDFVAALQLGLAQQQLELTTQAWDRLSAPPSADAFAAAMHRDPELDWPAMDYAFNLNRGSTHIPVHYHSSETLQVSGVPLRITSDHPFDRFTVLEASAPISADGLSDALTYGLSDGLLYSFRLLVKGEEYNPATAFELPHRTMHVVLALPDELFRRPIAIYRINDDGTRTFVHADVNGYTVTFDTDCTGTYLVGALTSQTSVPDVLIVVLAALLGGVFLLYRIKYPRTEKEEDE